MLGTRLFVRYLECNEILIHTTTHIRPVIESRVKISLHAFTLGWAKEPKVRSYELDPCQGMPDH